MKKVRKQSIAQSKQRKTYRTLKTQQAEKSGFSPERAKRPTLSKVVSTISIDNRSPNYLILKENHLIPTIIASQKCKPIVKNPPVIYSTSRFKNNCQNRKSSLNTESCSKFEIKPTMDLEAKNLLEQAQFKIQYLEERQTASQLGPKSQKYEQQPQLCSNSNFHIQSSQRSISNINMNNNNNNNNCKYCQQSERDQFSVLSSAFIPKKRTHKSNKENGRPPSGKDKTNMAKQQMFTREQLDMKNVPVNCSKNGQLTKIKQYNRPKLSTSRNRRSRSPLQENSTQNQNQSSSQICSSCRQLKQSINRQESKLLTQRQDECFNRPQTFLSNSSPLRTGTRQRYPERINQSNYDLRSQNNPQHSNRETLNQILGLKNEMKAVAETLQNMRKDQELVSSFKTTQITTTLDQQHLQTVQTNEVASQTNQSVKEQPQIFSPLIQSGCQTLQQQSEPGFGYQNNSNILNHNSDCFSQQVQQAQLSNKIPQTQGHSPNEEQLFDLMSKEQSVAHRPDYSKFYLLNSFDEVPPKVISELKQKSKSRNVQNLLHSSDSASPQTSCRSSDRNIPSNYRLKVDQLKYNHQVVKQTHKEKENLSSEDLVLQMVAKRESKKKEECWHSQYHGQNKFNQFYQQALREQVELNQKAKNSCLYGVASLKHL